MKTLTEPSVTTPSLTPIANLPTSKKSAPNGIKTKLKLTRFKLVGKVHLRQTINLVSSRKEQLRWLHFVTAETEKGSRLWLTKKIARNAANLP